MNTDGNHKLINLHRSDRGSVGVNLDTGASLETIRQTLQEGGLMTETDAFINKYDINVEKNSEHQIKLNEVLENDQDLCIGNPVRLNNLDGVTIQYFDEMSFDKKSVLLSEKYCNVFSGMTINGGRLSQTGRKLYHFAENYIPTAVNPNPNIETEELLTFSEDIHSIQSSGAVFASISLSTPWVNAEATFEHVKSKSRSGSKIRSYYTKRYLYPKAHMSVDSNKMVIEKDFARALINALSGREYSINGYQQLVEVLNTYGWYVPVQYTFGGAIYSTKTSEVDSFEKADSEKTSFSAEVEASFSFIGSKAGAGTSSTNETSSGGTQKKESVKFKQLGGKGISEDSISEWQASLNEPKYWNIIRYTSFLPSLMLLHGKYNRTLSTSLKLLTKYNSYAEVRLLQNDINVQEYENKIAYEINSITGE